MSSQRSALSTQTEALFQRALQLMPWGTQTNAKRPRAGLEGAEPLFAERAEGCRFWDTEGRAFIDYRSALGPIILGYRHPAVDEAVRQQLERGVLFSMASPVELDVAERLTSIIPGFEQVRFLKTGNTANLAALRLARAFTGRDHIVTCGYHGHNDWFVAGNVDPSAWYAGKETGVPSALDALVSRISYGDLDAAEEVFAKHGGAIAAVITVPYDWSPTPRPDFLRRLRDLCDRHGALLIFDEVLTGFRIGLEGARTYFDVMPDLGTFAKALANGYPLSAYGGRRDVMETLNDVILTTTYAGDTLSLAAAGAALDVMTSEPVHAHIWAMGRRLMDGFDAAARDLGFEARATGLPPAPQFQLHSSPAIHTQLQIRFYRILLEHGIFPAPQFLINYAHDEAAIDETVAAMAAALEKLSSFEVHIANL
ncbi:MAG: aminotransferase class III-fold pyridoxal phosphate-dependent enzyme, partial [Bacteroidota bacterium]